MAQYMILIYDDEVSWAGAAPGAMEEIVAEHTAFKNSYQEHLVDGHGLHPTTTATSVRTDSIPPWSFSSPTELSPKPKRPSASTT